MLKSSQNRPFKYGEADRREFIVQDSEVSIVAINNLSGSPVFLGRARAGSSLADEKWQIRKITYDSNSGVTRIEWPICSTGTNSTEYEFVWSATTTLTIIGISQAITAVVTVAAIGSIQNGDIIAVENVTGMTEVNFDGTNLYTVANVAGNTFELQGINSTGFGVYTGGGIVQYGKVTNLTYS